MTEALKRIIEFAKETMRVNRIYAHISADNRASVKAAKKQGFVKYRLSQGAVKVDSTRIKGR